MKFHESLSSTLRQLLSVGDNNGTTLRKQRRRQRVVHQTRCWNLLEFLDGVFCKAPIAAERGPPDLPGLLDQQVIIAEKNEDVMLRFGLVLTEFRKSHGFFACRMDDTNAEANRRASLSIAAVSSGTNSGPF